MQKIRNLFKHEDGFTLIELLVVIAVLGILAAIAIPRLSGVTDKAKLSEAVSAMGTLKNAQEMYFVEKDKYTSTNSDLFDYVEEESMPAGWTLTIDSSSDTSYQMEIVNDDGDLMAVFKKGWPKVKTIQEESATAEYANTP
jgi:general secretion pathway protein G